MIVLICRNWLAIADFNVPSSFSFYNTMYKSLFIIPGKHVGHLCDRLLIVL